MRLCASCRDLQRRAVHGLPESGHMRAGKPVRRRQSRRGCSVLGCDTFAYGVTSGAVQFNHPTILLTNTANPSDAFAAGKFAHRASSAHSPLGGKRHAARRAPWRLPARAQTPHRVCTPRWRAQSGPGSVPLAIDPHTQPTTISKPKSCARVNRNLPLHSTALLTATRQVAPGAGRRWR